MLSTSSIVTCFVTQNYIQDVHHYIVNIKQHNQVSVREICKYYHRCMRIAIFRKKSSRGSPLKHAWVKGRGVQLEFGSHDFCIQAIAGLWKDRVGPGRASVTSNSDLREETPPRIYAVRSSRRVDISPKIY